MSQRALVTVRVGDRDYPYRSEPRCKLCNHPMRREIEKSLAAGRTCGGLLNDLNLGADLTERNLQDHVANQHLPLNAPAARLVARQQADDVQGIVVPLVTAVAANLSLAHRIVDRVGQRLDEGVEEPTIRDGLIALRLIHEIERTSGDDKAKEWEEAAFATLEAIKAIMSEAQLAEFGRRMNQWANARNDGHGC